MPELLESITLGLVITFMIVGLIGIIVPLLPGTLLIWLGVLVYVLDTGFTAVSLPIFILLTTIALVTGTADLWLPLLGARTVGASWRSLIFGAVGALLGTFFIPIPLIGTLAGYALGILVGEYQKRGEWEAAIKASLGGLAGWGVATAVQLAGGLLMLLIFVWQVMAA
jgi:uncharacterized protein